MRDSERKNIEASVSGFYDIAASPLMVISRFFSRGLHYRMKRPQEINSVLARQASVSVGDSILDMGCGQGESVRWLLRRFDCRIHAVTISKKEASTVRRFASKRKYENRIGVHQENMLATHFEDAHFSLVWAIESMCHVDDKRLFAHEAYRLLKPKGRIVMADFFLTKEPDAKKDTNDYQNFRNGFLVPSLCTKKDFISILTEKGFKNVKYTDYSESIRDCAREREVLGFLNLLLLFPFTLVKIVPALFMQNSLGMIAQGRLFRHNIISYGVVYAEK